MTVFDFSTADDIPQSMLTFAIEKDFIHLWQLNQIFSSSLVVEVNER